MPRSSLNSLGNWLTLIRTYEQIADDKEETRETVERILTRRKTRLEEKGRKKRDDSNSNGE